MTSDQATPHSAVTGEFPPDDVEVARLRADVVRDLGSRYSVGDYLGRGAYATVWRATDRVTGEVVAVKRFLESRVQSRDFYRELSTLFRLQHDRVVRIINLQETPGGGRHLVLEYCAGGSLRRAISLARRGGVSCPPARAADIALQLLRGLSEAHRLGVIHRDLKPENLLFEKPDPAAFGGRSGIKLADFGLARALQRAGPGDGRLPSISGSPAYMAPEQFRGEFDPASDLYAVGVILYELLHGRLPFTGSPEELARHHLYNPVPFEIQLPAPWPEVLAGLLDKDPRRRPGTGELIRRLSENHSPAAAEPVNTVSIRQTRRETRWVTHRLGADARAVVVPAGGADVVAVADDGLMIAPTAEAIGARWMSLPGLGRVKAGPDRTIWVVQDGCVLRQTSTATRPSAVVTPGRPTVDFAPPVGSRPNRVIVADDRELSEWVIETNTRRAWTKPLTATAVARLPDGRVVAATAEPALVVLQPDGAESLRAALPGQCVAVAAWPGLDGSLALELERDGHRVVGRADWPNLAVERFVEARGLVATAVPAAGSCVYGLCDSGDVVRWHAGGQAEIAFRFDVPGERFTAYDTDGTVHAALTARRGLMIRC